MVELVEDVALEAEREPGVELASHAGEDRPLGHLVAEPPLELLVAGAPHEPGQALLALPLERPTGLLGELPGTLAQRELRPAGALGARQLGRLVDRVAGRRLARRVAARKGGLDRRRQPLQLLVLLGLRALRELGHDLLGEQLDRLAN